jgi:hypothetical protein
MLEDMPRGASLDLGGASDAGVWEEKALMGEVAWMVGGAPPRIELGTWKRHLEAPC